MVKSIMKERPNGRAMRTLINKKQIDSIDTHLNDRDIWIPTFKFKIVQ